MAILKKQNSVNYTSYSNNLLRNRELSYEARGILVELLSYPNDWKVQKKYFITPETGKDKVARIFMELENAGYLYHQNNKNIEKFHQFDWVVTDIPIDVRSRKIRPKTPKEVGKSDFSDQEVGKSDFVTQEVGKSDFSKQKSEFEQEVGKSALKPQKKSENPTSLKKSNLEKSENPPLLNIYNNNNIYNNKKNNKKKISENDSDFEFFRANYPKRSPSDDWHGANQKWIARLKEGEDKQKIIDGCLNYKKYCDLTNSSSEYVLMAKTFLGPAKHYLRKWEVKANAKSESGFDFYFRKKQARES